MGPGEVGLLMPHHALPTPWDSCSPPLSILILLASGLLQNWGYLESRAHSSLNKEPNTDPEA